MNIQMNKYMDELIDEWMYRCMSEQVDSYYRGMDGQIDRQKDICMYRWTDGFENRQIDGQINRQVNSLIK